MSDIHRDFKTRQVREILTWVGDRSSELAAIRGTHKQHPLQRLALYPERLGSDSKGSLQITACDTDEALRELKSTGDTTWLAKALDRAMSEDFSASAGVLAEIRAYGFLRLAGLNATPISESTTDQTADFVVKNAARNIRIEVTTKEMHGEEADELDAFREKGEQERAERRGQLRQHVTSPFGTGGPNAGNIASKVANMKSESKQFSEDTFNVLWIDFMDEDMWSLSKHDAQAISSYDGMFYSGGLWVSFYGKEGMPIADKIRYAESEVYPLATRQELPFPGRFNDDRNLVDMAVLVLPGSTILFQNPKSNKADAYENHYIPLVFANLLHFDFAASQIAYPSQDDLKARVASARSLHDALASDAKYGSF